MNARYDDVRIYIYICIGCSIPMNISVAVSHFLLWRREGDDEIDGVPVGLSTFEFIVSCGKRVSVIYRTNYASRLRVDIARDRTAETRTYILTFRFGN